MKAVDINKIEIPLQLRKDEFRFVLIRYKQKNPFEVQWTTKNNYKYDNERLQEHLRNGNYGLLCGVGDLVVIDCDCKELYDHCIYMLPRTFTIRTHSGWHLYYKCKDIKKKYILQDRDDIHFGEVQTRGTQVVAPNSVHNSGDIYTVVGDHDIVSIDEQDLTNSLFRYLKTKDKESIINKTSTISTRADDVISLIKDKVTIRDLLNSYGYDLKKNPTMCQLGHTSKGKACFSWDEKDNLWNCFHCGNGGDVFNFVMEHEGCSFAEAKKRLSQRIGLKVKTLEEVKEEENKYHIMSLQEVFDNGVPEVKWRVDTFLPERGISIFGGTSGSYKTFVAMHLALSVATGRPFLNTFECKKSGVLYIDEENGDITLPNRFDLLRKGFGYREAFTNVWLSVFNNMLLDTAEGLDHIKKLIDKLNVRVVIFDSMVRCMMGQEDKSDDVKKIYDNLKNIFKHYPDLSFILLHHTAKANPKNMNGLRGSGDFAAFADCITMFNTNHDGFVNMDIVKNRHIAAEDMGNYNLSVSQPENGGIWFNCLDKKKEEKSETKKAFESIIGYLKEAEITTIKTQKIVKNLLCQGFTIDVSKKTVGTMLREKCLTKCERGLYKINKEILSSLI